MKSTKEEVCSQPHNGVERTNESVGAGKAFRTRRRKGSPVRLRGGAKALPLRGGKTSGGAIRLRNVSQNQELQTLQVDIRSSRRREEGISGTQSTVEEFIRVFNPTIDNARLDRIELSPKIIGISGDLEACKNFQYFLGEAQSSDRLEGLIELHGRTFNVASTKSTNHKLKVRKKDIEILGEKYSAPLFAGDVRTIHFSGIDVIYLNALLTLNVSRALNSFQGLPNSCLEAFREMIMGRSTSPHKLTKGLDGNTNFIPLPCSDRQYAEFESLYLEGTLSGLVEECNRVASYIGCDVQGVAKLSEIKFRDIETYWEIETSDAVALLKELKPCLKVYAKKVQDREHGQQEGAEGNQSTFTAFLNNAESIKVYAKTLTRLRIEHKVNIKKVATEWMSENKSIVWSNVDDLRAWFASVKEKALERVLQMKQCVLQLDSGNVDARAPEYAHAWTCAFPEDEFAKGILGILQQNSRLVLGKFMGDNPREFERIAGKAKRLGLLKSWNGILYPCLPCQNSFSDELTRAGSNASSLVHKSGTQSRLPKDQNQATTRVVAGGERIPPPPPALDHRLLV